MIENQKEKKKKKKKKKKKNPDELGFVLTAMIKSQKGKK